jgi:hypothetical protein
MILSTCLDVFSMLLSIQKSPDDETVSAISGSITAAQASSSVEEHTSDSIIVTQETNSQTDNEVLQYVFLIKSIRNR